LGATTRLARILGITLLLPGAHALAQSVEKPAASTAVERGRYLASAGNCLSCHTRPGGAPMAGGVAFETPFGTVYSTNITPDGETGIGQWTVADLGRAMHEGVDRDGTSLIPAFPYTSFTKVTDADVADIYAYLRTVPAVRYSPPDNGLLLRMRWGVSLWKKLYFTPGRYVPDRAKSQEWNRGAYLVEGLGHCSACHTPRNMFMAEREEAAYQGGVFNDQIAAGKVGKWFAVNLTSSKHGLGSWSVADIEKYLRTGVSARAGTFGPMNEVIVNSMKLLTREDLQAMAMYAKSLPGPAYAGEVVSSEQVATGASTYKERCQKCHGESGRGGFFTGPPLAGSAVTQGEDPASLINIIVNGPSIAHSVSYGSWESMPAYADVLDDSEIAAVSNFVRGSWGNEAGPVSPTDVRAAR
jgi:mono/diheme cytochrome c family protein